MAAKHEEAQYPSFKVEGREARIFVVVRLAWDSGEFDANVFDRSQSLGAYQAGILGELGVDPEGIPQLRAWYYGAETIAKILEFVSQWANVPPEVRAGLEAQKLEYDREEAIISERMCARIAEYKRLRGL
jgi:hypothetical protein